MRAVDRKRVWGTARYGFDLKDLNVCVVESGLSEEALKTGVKLLTQWITGDDVCLLTGSLGELGFHLCFLPLPQRDNNHTLTSSMVLLTWK